MESKKTASADDGAVEDVYAPRKLNFAQNAILTLKVLAILGSLGAALWGINLWTSVE